MKTKLALLPLLVALSGCSGYQYLSHYGHVDKDWFTHGVRYETAQKCTDNNVNFLTYYVFRKDGVSNVDEIINLNTIFHLNEPIASVHDRTPDAELSFAILSGLDKVIAALSYKEFTEDDLAALMEEARRMEDANHYNPLGGDPHIALLNSSLLVEGAKAVHKGLKPSSVVWWAMRNAPCGNHHCGLPRWVIQAMQERERALTSRAREQVSVKYGMSYEIQHITEY